MTRDTIKKTKLSPDSVMQLAIQVKDYIQYLFCSDFPVYFVEQVKACLFVISLSFRLKIVFNYLRFDQFIDF